MPRQPLIEGSRAIENLVRKFPTAHRYFGEWETTQQLAQRLSFHDFVVLQIGFAWVFARRLDDTTFEIHWCFPFGVVMADLRRMLQRLFDDYGAERLVGETPKGHANEKAARIVSRAIGAVPENGVYTLTRDRFSAYTAKRLRGR